MTHPTFPSATVPSPLIQDSTHTREELQINTPTLTPMMALEVFAICEMTFRSNTMAIWDSTGLRGGTFVGSVPPTEGKVKYWSKYLKLPSRSAMISLVNTRKRKKRKRRDGNIDQLYNTMKCTHVRPPLNRYCSRDDSSPTHFLQN